MTGLGQIGALGRGLGLIPAKGVGDIIRSIFADGTDGFYFDFSKTDRLFQASTPQAAADGAGESIAYALDSHGWAGQSFPGVIAGQAEKVSNGDFSDGTTGWASSTFTSTAAVVDGELQVTPSVDFGRQQQLIATVAGRAYRITGRGRRVSGVADPYVVVNRSANHGDDLIVQYFSTTSFVDFSYVFVATQATTRILLSARTGNVAGFDDISVKEIPGNHSLQLTAAAQPKWQTGGLARFDGSDDNLLTTLVPGTSMTLAFKGTPNSLVGNRLVMGSNGVSGTSRIFLALDASGNFCGGVGADSVSTIKGSTNRNNTLFVGALTADGSTVRLYENGSVVYEAAQNGAINTTHAIAVGAQNAAGTVGTFYGGDLYHSLAIKKALTAAQIAAITNKWGTS